MVDEDDRSFFSAEFDLRTGAVKFVDFQDQQLIECIGRTLKLNR